MCPKLSWQALTPPGIRGKKVPQIILTSPYTPGQIWGKKCPKPSWQTLNTPPGNVAKKCPKPPWRTFTTPPPHGQCTNENNTFQKAASISTTVQYRVSQKKVANRMLLDPKNPNQNRVLWGQIFPGTRLGSA